MRGCVRGTFFICDQAKKIWLKSQKSTRMISQGFRTGWGSRWWRVGGAGGCHFGKDSAPGSYNCLNKIKCLFKYFISRAKNFGLLLARKGNLRDYQRQRDLVISTLRTRASQLFSGGFFAGFSFRAIHSRGNGQRGQQSGETKASQMPPCLGPCS